MDTIDSINMYLAKKGATGAEMSRSLGLSNGTYSQWNTRKTKPSKKMLPKIAEYLGVTVDQLLGIEKAATQEGSGDEPNKSALLAAVSSMSEAQAAELLRLWKVWQATQGNA